MGTRTIVTLALLTGCNYDYSIMGYTQPDPIASAPEEEGLDLVSDFVVEPTIPRDTGAVTDEVVASLDEDTDETTDTTTRVDADDTDAIAIDTDAVDVGTVLDTGSAPSDDTAIDPIPPADTDIVPVDTGTLLVDTAPPEELPVDPPPHEEPPPDPVPPEEPPPPPVDPTPPPVPELCDIELPTRWEAQSFAGGRESMVSHVGDIDGDGLDDAAWVNQLDSNVSILWGVAGGADPRNSTGWSNFSIGRSEGYVSWGDTDGDGRADLIASNQDYGRLRLLKSSGSRSLGTRVDITVPGFPQRVLLHDANGDGYLDVLFDDGWTGTTSIIMGSPGGWGSTIPFLGTSGQLRPVDLDGDGWDELVQSRTGNVYSDAGAPHSISSLPLDLGESIIGQVWPYDVDGDGDVDLVAHGSVDGTQVLLAWKNIAGDLVRCGQSAPIVPGLAPTGLGDLDGDGLPDYTSQSTCGYCSSTYFIVKGGK